MLYDIDKIDTSATLLAAILKEIHRHVFSLEDSLSSAQREAESCKMDVKKARDEFAAMSIRYEKEKIAHQAATKLVAQLTADVATARIEGERESAWRCEIGAEANASKDIIAKLKKRMREKGIQYTDLIWKKR